MQVPVNLHHLQESSRCSEKISQAPNFAEEGESAGLSEKRALPDDKDDRTNPLAKAVTKSATLSGGIRAELA